MKQTIEFNWDWPEKLEDYGTGRYFWTGDDWKRASEVRVVPSYDQETFDNGMDWFLFRAAPILFVFVAVWV
jgi:hypothetical protein